jgi:outer membrane assembly lipoprotein YfiO
MRALALVAGLVLPWLASCGSNDLPPMVGSGGTDSPAATGLFGAARQAENSGNTRKAVKLYGKLAEDHPVAPQAPEARFRQAKLLEQTGETVKAFDAYQEFITRYRGSSLYTQALESQARMAKAAADGEIKTSFLGLKSRLSTDKVVGMLEKVRDNAPASRTAPLAQFTIGELYQSRGDAARSIAAFRELVFKHPDSSEAAEGQYRIGVILTEQAERGNQDQANIDLAREAFQDYLQRYPGHSRNDEARRRLGVLGTRDLQRSFDIAEFYLRKGDTGSAKFYYHEVVREAKSGPLHDRAKARLAELGE